MDVELTNDNEKLIQFLGDRIEEIERTLHDDEDFCNKDIDATYQAAVKYIKILEEKFHKKLNEIKDKLEQIRKDNINISKQNKKQFDDDIDEINQLFSSGKHQEALEKFHDYEKRFQQRTTIIQNIPKLYMNDIDINRYLSFDKPIISSNNDKQIIKTQYSTQKTIEIDLIKKENDDINEQEFNKSPFAIRSKHVDNQQILTNNNSINKDTKSPLCPKPFSTRLPPSPSNKSLSTTERDISTPSSIQSNQNFRENMTSYTQVRSTPSSPNIVSPFTQRQMSTVKISKGEGLTQTYVANYQHERNTSLLMTCNKNYIILYRNQSDRLNRWSLSIIERSNSIEQNLKWGDRLIISIGFINKNHIYIFTKHDFTIYSLDLFSELNSWILLNSNNDLPRGIGTVYDKYIYHISVNIKHHWILSIFELETINHLYDFDLTENFPKIKRFIYICINDKIISFLVEMDGSQYGVIFCSNNNYLKIELKKLIQLSYAENPLTISSVYISYIEKYLFFINDPSAKIIHILTNEKYLQSYSIIAYTLCYIEDNHELILTSNNGIHSINIDKQESFFLKFH